MAGPGKQRKLGPGPESGVCGSRDRPGSCVGVARRLCKPACSPLRETQARCQKPTAPSHLPRRPPGDTRPRARAVAAAGEGVLGRGRGAGKAGRRRGRRGARVGGRCTSRLLWLSGYIRCRRAAALPTLAAPAGATRSPRIHPSGRTAHRRSGHGQSDGGQVGAGAAAFGAAPTHAGEAPAPRGLGLRGRALGGWVEPPTLGDTLGPGEGIFV
jgi:hypothetical protein